MEILGLLSPQGNESILWSGILIMISINEPIPRNGILRDKSGWPRRMGGVEDGLCSAMTCFWYYIEPIGSGSPLRAETLTMVHILSVCSLL